MATDLSSSSAARRDSAHASSLPVPSADRVFGFGQHASLWFSLGVGLLVMQVGSFLVPALSLRDALLAIVAGSVLGAGLLAWVAAIGCREGLSSSLLIARLSQQLCGHHANRNSRCHRVRQRSTTNQVDQ